MADRANAAASHHRDARPNTRAAVCVAGELRALLQKPVQDNWAHALLRPLRPHVFLQVSAMYQLRPCPALDVACRTKHCLSNCSVRPRPREASSEEVDTLLAWLKPWLRSAVIRSDSQWAQRAPQIELAKWQWKLSGLALGKDESERKLAAYRDGDIDDTLCIARHESACKPILTTRWRSCLSEIEREEREQGRRYGWVIRARPDLLWKCVLTPPTAVATHGHVVAIDDQMWVGTRAVAGLLLNRTCVAPEQECEPSCDGHSPCFDHLVHAWGGTIHWHCPLVGSTYVGRAAYKYCRKAGHDTSLAGIVRYYGDYPRSSWGAAGNAMRLSDKQLLPEARCAAVSPSIRWIGLN